ncbi:MAG TPA: hypothetical protein DCZ91_03820 [Lachnospiraceae bacterium]|nr:hypothetical protein [Lachnospiraceae bacterium]
MHKFTTILWDVDNTLLDFAYSQRHALARCFRSPGEMEYIPDYTISDLHMIYDIIGADLPPL